jgi:regulatory protein
VVRQSIKTICLKLLAQREHGRNELFNKLTKKGFCPSDIQPVLMELEQMDLQSDQRFIESYVRQRLQKGYGVIAIRYELAKKGINFALKSDDILLTMTDDGWFSLLTQVYTKKYGEILPITYQEWLKRRRFLIQRGFSASQLAQFVSESQILRS